MLLSAKLFILLASINLVFIIPRVSDLKPKWQCLIVTIVVILWCVSYEHMMLLTRIAGIFTSVSVTTLILLIAILLRNASLKSFIPSHQIKVMCLFLMVVGMLFYPMTLGWTMYDPYRLGFQLDVLLIGWLLLVIFSIHKNYWLMMITLTVSLLVFIGGFGLSTNLWDYLIDPMGFLIATIYLLTVLAQYCLAKILNYTSIKT